MLHLQEEEFQVIAGHVLIGREEVIWSPGYMTMPKVSEVGDHKAYVSWGMQAQSREGAVLLLLVLG